MTVFPKPGIVRLIGKGLAVLRRQCWERDKGICQVCGCPTYWMARFAGDPQAYDMAHIRVRRLGGDVIDNVRTLCHSCHQKSHNCGGSPVPRKV